LEEECKIAIAIAIAMYVIKLDFADCQMKQLDPRKQLKDREMNSIHGQVAK
jgi:hypothetical protein